MIGQRYPRVRLIVSRWYPSRGPEEDKGPQMVDYVATVQIYGLTAVKIAVHGLLRWISGGRYGRVVTPLRHLIRES